MREEQRHGCTLFDFLVEVLGNDRGTSVDFHGCRYGLPWKSAGFHGKGHGSWRFDGTCHGCGHGTCRGSVRGELRGTNHGHPRKAAAIATAISADVKPQQFPRPSAAIATATLRYAAITTEVRGNCHGNFRGRQTTAILTAIHSHCHGNPPIRGKYHGSPRQLPRPFPRTSNHSNFHGHPQQSSDTRELSRKSTAIATAISMAFCGHPWQLNCHFNRRQFSLQSR